MVYRPDRSKEVLVNAAEDPIIAATKYSINEWPSSHLSYKEQAWARGHGPGLLVVLCLLFVMVL